EFNALRDAGTLLEWAEVHGNFYGTPRDRIDEALNAGRDVLLEIDWQGARQVRKFLPDAIGVFILPPSIGALETRLKARGQDEPHVIARRLLAAGSEMAHVSECQYVIINQEFSVALQELSHIVKAARLRYTSQAARHAELSSQLGISKTDNGTSIPIGDTTSRKERTWPASPSKTASKRFPTALRSRWRPPIVPANWHKATNRASKARTN